MQRRGDKLAREWVLACVDGSDYAGSVCDHAGWFASDPEVGVDVLHAVEPGATAASGNLLVERALWRLRDEGVGPLAGRSFAGDLVDAVGDPGASVVVIGKRGVDSGPARTALGRHVDAAVRRCPAPLCLAPKVFLPIHRALVLLDTDLAQHTALDLVASDVRLSKLSLDVAVFGGQRRAVDAKLELARRRLATASADVFPLPCDSPDAALAQYMRSRAADMIVLSRPVVARNPQTELSRIEEDGLWGARAPVLIC